MQTMSDVQPAPADSAEVQLLAHIRRAGRGSVWCAERFGTELPRNSIDQALVRLTHKGILVRIAHGVYYYPTMHPLSGQQQPMLADVLQMLADVGVGPLIPTGATAAALFGLCDAVPTVVQYGGVGVSRTIATSHWTLYVRPIATRAIEGLHPLTAMLIQAMRHIGQAQWTDAHVQLVRRTILKASYERIVEQSVLAPAWMRASMRNLIKAHQDIE